ncbi:MAG TPA: DUF1127 domain-containing protein [Methylomirabilota bacterium]|nr:DUF1127 domain-containing protein [Methylomirabilota bacterium]
MTTSRCTATAGVAWPDARPARGGLAAFLALLAEGWHRQQAVRTLGALDDRQLRDLGIERGQIETVADALIATRRARSP